jgi:hypothetical protein
MNVHQNRGPPLIPMLAFMGIPRFGLPGKWCLTPGGTPLGGPMLRGGILPPIFWGAGGA